jgi:hypothetical protein
VRKIGCIRRVILENESRSKGLNTQHILEEQISIKDL